MPNETRCAAVLYYGIQAPLARFEVSPVHHATRAHTQELYPNDQTL
jgi:hypothetical protein